MNNRFHLLEHVKKYMPQCMVSVPAVPAVPSADANGNVKCEDIILAQTDTLFIDLSALLGMVGCEFAPMLMNTLVEQCALEIKRLCARRPCILNIFIAPAMETTSLTNDDGATADSGAEDFYIHAYGDFSFGSGASVAQLLVQMPSMLQTFYERLAQRLRPNMKDMFRARGTITMLGPNGDGSSGGCGLYYHADLPEVAMHIGVRTSNGGTAFWEFFSAVNRQALLRKTPFRIEVFADSELVMLTTLMQMYLYGTHEQLGVTIWPRADEFVSMNGVFAEVGADYMLIFCAAVILTHTVTRIESPEQADSDADLRAMHDTIHYFYIDQYFKVNRAVIIGTVNPDSDLPLGEIAIFMDNFMYVNNYLYRARIEYQLQASDIKDLDDAIDASCKFYLYDAARIAEPTPNEIDVFSCARDQFFINNHVDAARREECMRHPYPGDIMRFGITAAVRGVMYELDIITNGNYDPNIDSVDISTNEIISSAAKLNSTTVKTSPLAVVNDTLIGAIQLSRENATEELLALATRIETLLDTAPTRSAAREIFQILQTINKDKWLLEMKGYTEGRIYEHLLYVCGINIQRLNVQMAAARDVDADFIAILNGMHIAYGADKKRPVVRLQSMIDYTRACGDGDIGWLGFMRMTDMLLRPSVQPIKNVIIGVARHNSPRYMSFPRAASWTAAMRRVDVDEGARREIIDTLALNIPVGTDIEVRITKKYGVDVFFRDWADDWAEKYVTVVFMTTTGNNLNVYTRRLETAWALGSSGLSILIGKKYLSVNFFNVLNK
jgi:hypothetical protein